MNAEERAILVALVRDVNEIKGYWTEGLDNSMQAAEALLKQGKAMKIPTNATQAELNEFIARIGDRFGFAAFAAAIAERICHPGGEVLRESILSDALGEEPERDPAAGDICTRCGEPIDHKEPHVVCDKCRAENG